MGGVLNGMDLYQVGRADRGNLSIEILQGYFSPSSAFTFRMTSKASAT